MNKIQVKLVGNAFERGVSARKMRESFSPGFRVNTETCGVLGGRVGSGKIAGENCEIF